MKEKGEDHSDNCTGDHCTVLPAAHSLWQRAHSRRHVRESNRELHRRVRTVLDRRIEKRIWRRVVTKERMILRTRVISLLLIQIGPLRI